MIFVPYYELKAGMKLASNIHLDNNKKSKAFLLKKGMILTNANIQKLINFNVLGAYIDDGRKNLILDDNLRKKSVTTIKNIFEMCKSKHKILEENVIKEIESISVKLVNNMCKNKKTSIGITDLQSYDVNTYLHSLSVTVISIAIGSALNLSKKELCDLGVCGLLHDIGKVAIPIEIIGKPSKLTEEEFNIVKTHAELGGNYIVENKYMDNDIYLGVISHHEKFDGTGYPNKLKREDIPLFGRIITVADVYDALTGNRPYRNPIKPLEAIEYIMAGVGSSFDYNVVKAFLKKIEPYPIGSCVKLSDKRRATVIGDNINNPLRPIIKILQKNGDEAEIIDLQNDLNARNIIILDIEYKYLIKK
ncbi:MULTISPECIES: HD-GYP domain-containing protein [Clostridium]|uniref:HD-GYP domain-containing protein n=1 Tax=Clostridium aquiflavi TaxID=3073603 RepID=A0ABU1EBX7_9CLOT|nr:MULTISPECIES: HD-GYP domain-containing protein [unclassified Clostridium]MDR5585888.1 HD-GYP domain-containing protein [Clostridium sp. 5N-1]NFG60889.1 HD-GYP domain-containing protein [Clostridium botulinum]NFQ09526.1 HD-GYP domain-containing protein [Clostridium botulinum]